MSVWLTIPSKRSPDEAEPVLKQWRERGYRIALFTDCPTPGVTPPAYIVSGLADSVLEEFTYQGYAAACNELMRRVVNTDRNVEWFVTGGDDVLPDPNHTAEEIAIQCSQYFAPGGTPSWNGMEATFGVMQPTGDRDFGDAQGPYIDRVAGSPWIGREFARRMYQGSGPYWPEYTHMGVDEELQAVAIKYGVFWQRPDLTHFHQHWGRPRPGERLGQADRMPEFLEKANSGAEWKRYKRIFAERQAAGFPGSEPL